METNLRNCPFCGSDAKVSSISNDVYCSNDECINADTYCDESNWNTRPLEDALQTKLNIAVEALEKLIEIINDDMDETDLEEFISAALKKLEA